MLQCSREVPVHQVNDTPLRLLDAFCGGGGAGQGYIEAGFSVTGVDLADHAKHYPGTFVQGDAVEFIRAHGHEFDVIHASPPCQHASAGTRALRVAGMEFPDLVEETRDALFATGVPFVIENVPAANLRRDLMLCGKMFNLTALDYDGELLQLYRHRVFELGRVSVPQPNHPVHRRSDRVGGVYGGGRRDKVEARTVRHGGYQPPLPVQRKLMDAEWLPKKSLQQAIPPAYSRHIGTHLVNSLVSSAHFQVAA